MPAVPVKVIVGPARSSADRRSPERPAEHGADHAANDRAGRSGHDQSGARARGGADHIGARSEWSRSDCGENCGCQQDLTHQFLLLLVQHRHAAPPAVNLIADRDEDEIPTSPP
jgi:hypothetical protein